MYKIIILFVSFFILSCASSIKSKLVQSKYQNLGEELKMLVLEPEEILPPNSELIGNLKIGDAGLTIDCGYDKVLATALSSAKKSGANILQISNVSTPDGISSCYRIKAKMYRNTDQAMYDEWAALRKIKNKTRLPADANYAIIHFYRPNLFVGALLGYKVKDENDVVIGRLRNGEKFTFKTEKFGLQSFYGNLETKEEIQINIEKGQEYFVRCGVKMGVVLGRPEINLIENYVGIKEFEKMQ